jgi:tetratricopeptide (TPR) repeat protein
VIGRFEEALVLARRGVEAEPRSANAQAAVGWRTSASDDTRRRASSSRTPRLSTRRPRSRSGPSASRSSRRGRFEEAIGTLEQCVALTKREHFFQLALLGGRLAAGGREADARRILDELRDRAKSVYVPPYDLAVLHLALGEKEETLKMLERAYDERNALLWYRIHMPAFDSLIGEPRYRAIADKLARTAPMKAGGGWR